MRMNTEISFDGRFMMMTSYHEKDEDDEQLVIESQDKYIQFHSFAFKW